MPPARPYRVLRHRDYRRFWSASLVSLTGSQMQSAAIDWHIYLLTGSPLAIGMVGLVRVVPIVVFSLWGGVAADRQDRRVLVGTAQPTMAVLALVLAAVTFTGRDHVAWIYLLTAFAPVVRDYDQGQHPRR